MQSIPTLPTRLLVVVTLAVSSGCGGASAAPPTAGEARGFVPDLAGRRVMVFPVQSVSAVVTGDLDAELVFALEQRGESVSWIGARELERAVRGSPGYDVRVEGLPVGIFQRAEVRRVGDPLYGYLRRLAPLVDSEIALIPVAAGYGLTPEDSVGPGGAEPPGRVQVSAALIAVVSGRVLWYGVAAGEPGPPGDPAVVASALDALAVRLAPPSERRSPPGGS